METRVKKITIEVSQVKCDNCGDWSDEIEWIVSPLNYTTLVYMCPNCGHEIKEYKDIEINVE